MPEDKRKSRIRYGAVFAILLLLYAAAVSFLVRMRLPAMMDATRIAEHIELYMQGPVPEPSAAGLFAGTLALVCAASSRRRRRGKTCAAGGKDAAAR